jgi:acid phosphatase family membrane protein YuiD
LLGVCLALLIIVTIDAIDTRKKIEDIARVLRVELGDGKSIAGLRDKTGHNPIDVIGGVGVGFLAALITVCTTT